MNNTNLTSNRSVGMVTIGVTLLLIVVALTAPACSYPIGSNFERTFLLVDSATDTMDAQPSISFMNLGDDPVFVSGFGFVLRADDDLTVTTPPGCTALYEDMVDERVLRISCFGDAEIKVDPDEEVVVNLDVQGPWTRLDLVSVLATDENGEPVWNNISGDFNPPAWNNPSYY